MNVVPMVAPAGFEPAVARIDVDLWERPERAKAGLQQVAERVASAFQEVAGADRRVKVALRPYPIDAAGWVSR